VEAHFVVLAQEHFSVAKRYQVLATPFAFLINEKGIITSDGIINNRQHIQFVLSGARANNGHAEAETARAESDEPKESPTVSSSKEVRHV
jgi:hypothetical protein